MRNTLNHTLSNLSTFELNYFKNLFGDNDVRSSFSSSQKLQEDGTTISELEDYHLMRVSNRWWDESDIKEIDEKVEKFNSFCRSCQMEVFEFTNEESEWDNDRKYPAYFQFRIIPKK
jgi:hypothetical protein